MNTPEAPAIRRAPGRRLGQTVAVVAAFVLGIGGTILYQHREWLKLPGWSSASAPPTVVLIGMDGADWNLIDPLISAGRMPNMASLIKRGARGRLLTISPTLSPVIWTSIATGVKPERHGIVDFTAVNTETGEAVPVTSNLRRVPALWNLLSDAGKKVGFVGWWASFPAEHVDGYIVSDRIAYQLFGVKADEKSEGKTWPAELFEQIKPLIMDPKSVPDSFTARFFDDPTVLNTKDPEELELLDQFRTILASGESYRKISAALAAKYRPAVESVYLEGTDTVAHLFMRYRPPQLPGVPPDRVRRFGGVLDRYYQYADELLGEIVARNGEGATYVVCSDHGFRSGRDRPVTSDSRIDKGRGADWHRKYGVLIVAGPAARVGTEIREATVFDVAPTVLALAGAAIPQNLDGRVLTDSMTEEFQRSHPLRSLEPARAAEPRHASTGASSGGSASAGGTSAGSLGTRGSPETPIATENDEEIRQRLISLGYLTEESNNAHNNRGIIFLGKGEFDRAIAEFKAAMRDNPQFAEGYINIARAYWQKGDDAAATENLHKAGSINPKMKEVPLMLGNIALKAGLRAGTAPGYLKTAEEQFLKALELEPNDTDTLNCLGLVYDARGDAASGLPASGPAYDKAASYFLRATEVDADFAEGYNNLGNVSKKRGDVGTAESWYRKAIEADPFFMGSYNNLALIYQERGDFERAADLYRQALEKDNANPDLHNNLGSLLFRRGDLHAAEDAFRRSIALDSKYAEGHNSLGVVFGAQKKDAEERAEYEKAIDLKPGYADAIYNLGLWHIKHGDDREGERLLREAIRFKPDYPAALGALSGIRIRKDDAAGARKLLDRALSLQPNNPRLLALLGESLFRLGDRSAAEKALKRSLELQPGQKDVEERLKGLEKQ